MPVANVCSNAEIDSGRLQLHVKLMRHPEDGRCIYILLSGGFHKYMLRATVIFTAVAKTMAKAMHPVQLEVGNHSSACSFSED